MSSQSNKETGNDVRVPLVVDVDGTLVSGDLLIEGLARFLAASPLRLLAPAVLAGPWPGNPETSDCPDGLLATGDAGAESGRT